MKCRATSRVSKGGIGAALEQNGNKSGAVLHLPIKRGVNRWRAISQTPIYVIGVSVEMGDDSLGESGDQKIEKIVIGSGLDECFNGILVTVFRCRTQGLLCGITVWVCAMLKEQFHERNMPTPSRERQRSADSMVRPVTKGINPCSMLEQE